MRVPSLVIVAGPPATGKTTLGRRLAADLHLPYYGKDVIKETLFDTLGWSDRAWSRQLGVASIAILYTIVETQLRAGCSLLVESNFQREWDDERFSALIERYPCHPVQVQCRAQGDVLLRRFQERDSSSERHPGHVERLQVDEQAGVLLRGYHDPLDIPGHVFHVDTTDFTVMDYEGLRRSVIRALGQCEDSLA